jgi:hypothetical protein
LSKNGERVELKVLLSNSSVRLYGNRAFFKHLRSEVDRLIDCPPLGHCEFQTISLEAELPDGLSVRPKYNVLRIDDDEEDFERAEILPKDAFDLVFMVVENE